MTSVTLRLHLDGNRRRAARSTRQAQRDALDNADAAVFEELRAEDAARQQRQLEFGGDSLRMMLCGPQTMVKDMKGKDGAALTYAGSAETYLASDGDGCQVYTPWTTLECKQEHTLREAILMLLHTQPALANATAESMEALIEMEALQAFYVMDEDLFTFDDESDADGWAYALPIRKDDKWVRVTGDECWTVDAAQLDHTMEVHREHGSNLTNMSSPAAFWMSSDKGGNGENLIGMRRLRVQLKVPLPEWAAAVEDFWPVTKKFWSDATRQAIRDEDEALEKRLEAEHQQQQQQEQAQKKDEPSDLPKCGCLVM
jgi:hypothetical protein